MTKEKVRLVCTRVRGEPLMFPDNKTGPCFVCGWTVQYRPHASKDWVLICVQCFEDRVTSGDEVALDRRMVEDFLEYVRKQQQ